MEYMGHTTFVKIIYDKEGYDMSVNFTLIFVLLLIGILALIGWIKGLVEMVYGLCASIVILILTLVFNPVVRDFAKGNETIYTAVYSTVDSKVKVPVSSLAECEEFIRGLELPKTLENGALKLVSNSAAKDEDIFENFDSYIKNKLTELVISALAFLITALIACIAVNIAFWALDLLSKLPVIHTANKILGLTLGVIEGFLLVTLILAVIPVFSTTTFGSFVISEIRRNKFLEAIYEHNVLSNISSWITGWKLK